MPKKPIHIGVLTLPSNFHGEKWSRALARAGAQVTIFTLDAGGLSMSASTDGVAVVNIPPPISWGGRYRYPSYYFTAARLRKLLAEHKVDVLHPLHLTPFGTWAIQTGFRPVIAAAMGADVLEYPPSNFHLQQTVRTWRQAEVTQNPIIRWQEQLRNRFFRAQVQQVINKADLLTGDNQPLVDAMIEWFGAPAAKTRLLRWGLEPELLTFTEADRQAVRAKWRIPPGARVVFSPRGANALYQADIILAAFEQLLAEPAFSNYHFIMLGAGYEAAGSIFKKASELMARYPNFRFVGEQLPRLAVYALWSVVDIFVSAPVYDGYSAAVAEGRYVGAIPVLNAIPGNQEIIQHRYNGLLVEPFTAANLANALQDVDAKYPAYKAEFAPRNRAWIEEHSILSRNADKLLGWAEELVSRA